MNPKIPADYLETARWLEGFVRSHAKRESSRLEVAVDRGPGREGRSYGVSLLLDGRPDPATDLDFREVADGRTRFAWCATLAEGVRARARALVAASRSAG